MSAALVPTAPNREELEALTLADRVALENVFGEATELIRSLNDAEIGQLVRGGASLSALAEVTGLTKQGVSKRLDRLGLQTAGQIAPGVNRFTPPTPKR